MTEPFTRLDSAIRRVITTHRAVKSVRCECTGFVLQYEGGCQCQSKRRAETANSDLRQALDILDEAFKEAESERTAIRD